MAPMRYDQLRLVELQFIGWTSIQHGTHKGYPYADELSVKLRWLPESRLLAHGAAGGGGD